MPSNDRADRGYRRNSTDFTHPENYATFDNYCEPEPARPAGRGDGAPGEFLTNGS